MEPARSLSCLVLLAAPLAAQGAPSLTLSIAIAPEAVEFRVGGLHPPFAGAVLLALEPHLAHHFVGLPPLLAGSVVLGVSLAAHDEGCRFALPLTRVPPGVTFHAHRGPAIRSSSQTTHPRGAATGPGVSWGRKDSTPPTFQKRCGTRGFAALAAQGVGADGKHISASDVGGFVLDATGLQ